jgi:hypothetical protein
MSEVCPRGALESVTRGWWMAPTLGSFSLFPQELEQWLAWGPRIPDKHVFTLGNSSAAQEPCL